MSGRSRERRRSWGYPTHQSSVDRIRLDGAAQVWEYPGTVARPARARGGEGRPSVDTTPAVSPVRRMQLPARAGVEPDCTCERRNPREAARSLGGCAVPTASERRVTRAPNG